MLLSSSYACTTSISFSLESLTPTKASASNMPVMLVLLQSCTPNPASSTSFNISFINTENNIGDSVLGGIICHRLDRDGVGWGLGKDGVLGGVDWRLGGDGVLGGVRWELCRDGVLGRVCRELGRDGRLVGLVGG